MAVGDKKPSINFELSSDLKTRLDNRCSELEAHINCYVRTSIVEKLERDEMNKITIDTLKVLKSLDSNKVKENISPE